MLKLGPDAPPRSSRHLADAPLDLLRAEVITSHLTKRNTGLGQKKAETDGGSSSARGEILQELDEGIVDLSPIVVDNPSRLAFHVLHQAIQIISRIGNANHADSGAVP
jgi:hypothetical protein